MRFAADENFHNDIIRGLQRQQPELDIVRIQDTEIYQSADPAVLEWAAKEGRILLTHDVRTMPNHANERITTGKSLPGVFIVNDQMPIGKAIEELLTVIGASEADEWENLVVFFPL
jgi:hypothetical protein